MAEQKKDRGVRGPIYAIFICMMILVAYLFDRDYIQESNFEKTYLQERRFSRLAANCVEDQSNECNRLGMVYEHGQGVEQSFEKAFEAYEKACGLDSKYGCFNVGRFYAQGTPPVEQDFEKAIENYRISCFERHHKWACTALGELRLYAPNSQKLWNDNLAFEAFAEGCNITAEQSCAFVGMLRLQKRVKPPASPSRAEKAETQSLSFLRTNCTQFFLPSEACAYFFETHYDPSVEDETTNKDTFYRYQHQCKFDEDACPMVGVMFRRGIYRPKDLEHSNKNLPETCETNVEGNYGCVWRGLNELELGNKVTARKLFEPACRTNNHFIACQKLRELDAERDAQPE